MLAAVVSPSIPDTPQFLSPAYRSGKLRVIPLAAATLRSHGRPLRPLHTWKYHEKANRSAGACRFGGLHQGVVLGCRYHPLHLRLCRGGFDLPLILTHKHNITVKLASKARLAG